MYGTVGYAKAGLGFSAPFRKAALAGTDRSCHDVKRTGSERHPKAQGPGQGWEKNGRVELSVCRRGWKSGGFFAALRVRVLQSSQTEVC
mmetsp:Transcript_6075/g.12932  ORF Transcript_6075/g.12932 Transcript_6075/m.12932 type:complete len:89 (+) Transcript_6075:141-407(+)